MAQRQGEWCSIRDDTQRRAGEGGCEVNVIKYNVNVRGTVSETNNVNSTGLNHGH